MRVDGYPLPVSAPTSCTSISHLMRRPHPPTAATDHSRSGPVCLSSLDSCSRSQVAACASVCLRLLCCSVRDIATWKGTRTHLFPAAAAYLAPRMRCALLTCLPDRPASARRPTTRICETSHFMRTVSTACTRSPSCVRRLSLRLRFVTLPARPCYSM